jgi:hypothetical protein
MPIFDFLSGQFIDVIHWTDDTRSWIPLTAMVKGS